MNAQDMQYFGQQVDIVKAKIKLETNSYRLRMLEEDLAYYEIQYEDAHDIVFRVGEIDSL